MVESEIPELIISILEGGFSEVRWPNLHNGINETRTVNNTQLGEISRIG